MSEKWFVVRWEAGMKRCKIKLEPRKKTEYGGYACMPLLKNCPDGHKDWKLTNCPKCGAECWKRPEVSKLENENGVIPLCTLCALKEGI